MPARPHYLPSLDWLPILLGQGSGVLCGLIGVRLISTWVPANTLGTYGLFLILAPIGPLFTHAGVAKHAAWQWPITPNHRQYLGELWRASGAPTLWLIGLIAVCWAAAEIMRIPWSSPTIWVCLLIANLGSAYVLVFQSALQGARAYWRDASITMTTSLGRTFLPLLIFILGWQTLTSLTVGFAAHTLLAAGWAYANLLKTMHRNTTSAQSPEATFAQFHRSFAVAGVLTVINLGMNRWIGSHIFDATELGHFTLASNLAIVLPNVLSGACWQYFFPRMVSAFAKDDQLHVRKLLDRALLLFLGSALLTGTALRLILPHLVGFLIDARYASSLDYLLPLYAHGTALAICFYHQGLLHAIGRARASLLVTAVGTFTLCAGSLIAAFVSVHGFILWLWLSPLVVLIVVRPYTLRLFRKPPVQVDEDGPPIQIA